MMELVVRMLNPSHLVNITTLGYMDECGRKHNLLSLLAAVERGNL